MAYTTNIEVNGIIYPVTHYDHTAQQIDDAVANMGAASTPQAALAALGAGVRNNELDNPGLDINQRGQSSYDTTIASSYTVDRWWNLFGIYDVATKTIESANQTYGFGFRQPINNPRRFVGKTVTLTAWILSGNGSIRIVKSTGLNSGLSAIGSIPINGPGLYSKTFNIPDDVGSDTYPYMLVSVGAPVGGSIQFASPIPVKLEFGEGQTLAYQDSGGNWQLLPQPDNNYAAQLLKCQQYQVYNTASAYFRAAYVSSNAIGFNIPIPGTLRTNPVFDGSPKVYPISLSGEVTGFTFAYYTYPGYVRAVATKNGHGLSDATLLLPAGMFNSNL